MFHRYFQFREGGIMTRIKPLILVTRRIPQVGIDLLRPFFELDIHDSSVPLTPEELASRLKSADGVLSILTDDMNEGIISSAPKLKIISNHAVGFDNIDVAAATKRGIVVSNTPGVLTQATAEFTWALIFAVARHIVPADAFARAGLYKGWDPMLFLGMGLAEKTLGIIGMGRIGRAVAHIAQAFSMKLLYHDTGEIVSLPFHQCSFVPLFELAEKSDIITIHVPLNEKTYHLCNPDFFARCKPSAILINTARGSIVDEHALVQALEKGLIQGAGLDVFEEEPLIHPQLLTRDDVVLIPHLGSATHETRNRMASRAAQNIIDFFTEGKPQFIVNPAVFKQEGA